MCLIKPGEISSIGEVSDHPTAEAPNRTEFQLVGDLVLPHEHEAVKRKNLFRVPSKLLMKTPFCGAGETVGGMG